MSTEIVEAPVPSSPPDRWIRRIFIEALFGQYTYDLRLSEGDRPGQVLLLYGENGAGKTTVLRLVFNLLNHQHSGTHKSQVAQTLFRRLLVELNDGSLVEAVRSGNQISGSFQIRVSLPGQAPVIADVVANEHGVVDRDDKANRSLRTANSALQRLGIRFYFVTDARELLSNRAPTPPTGHLPFEIDEDTVDTVFTTSGTAFQRFLRASHQPVRRHHVDAALDGALKSALEWAKEQVLKGSRQGEADASSLYAEIVKGLTSAATSHEQVGPQDFEGILRELEAQAKRSSEFARFGIPTAANLDKLLAATREVHGEYTPVTRILQPYVETLRARLDALNPVQRGLRNFVSTINSFYVDKSVSFNLQTGIRITSAGGTQIKPSALSSGEKQLLLLFCNTLIATGRTTIVLIDEPELSLNVKWQRQLVKALLGTTRNRNIQFVLATHSFEILAQHHENVVHLHSDTAGRSDAATTNDSGVTHVS